MTTKKPSAAELVRSMSNAEPEEIVAAAKKAGLTITTGYVGKVRTIDKARAVRSSGAAKTTKTAPRATKPRAAGKPSRGPRSSGAPRSSPKREAVLAIGLDKATSAIVAAAKAQGVNVSGAYVDVLKKAAGAATARNKRGPGRKSASGAARASGRPGRPISHGTPSDFIRSMPDASPAEILVAAKSAGVTFSRGLIYMVRSHRGASGAKRPAAVKRGPGRPRKEAAPGAASPSERGAPDTANLRAIVAAYVVEHGLASAQRIVDDVGAKIRAAASR